MSYSKVALVGFMGSGKTTVGIELAHNLSCPLIDLDGYIVSKIGRSISDIFQTEGEVAFRTYETASLFDVADLSYTLVLSTGGGVVTVPQNRRLLKEQFTTIMLEASVDTILHRLSQDSSRPLLDTGENRRQRIIELLAQRNAYYYETADHVIDVNDLDIQQVVTAIEELLR